ncbi:DUF1289 domain-containing protein [Thalassospira povalilytica]|uniref:DUF1289 domain-containing protein n=1 Tax=Thalassospira povalilytica TaxID=732237 RepID=UPI003AA9458B
MKKPIVRSATGSRAFKPVLRHTDLFARMDRFRLDPCGRNCFLWDQSLTIPPRNFMPVKSPCIGVCVLDAKAGYCTGCFRTGDEIGAWMGLSDGEKKRVLAKSKTRKKSHQNIRQKQTGS